MRFTNEQRTEILTGDSEPTTLAEALDWIEELRAEVLELTEKVEAEPYDRRADHRHDTLTYGRV